MVNSLSPYPKSRLLHKINHVAMALFVVALMAAVVGCGTPLDSITTRATDADIIGIWARYKSFMKHEKDYKTYDIDNDTIWYDVFFKDGTGVMLTYKRGANEYYAIDFTWRKARRSEIENFTDDGIVISTEHDRYDYRYYNVGGDTMDPHFIDERLVEGNLGVEYDSYGTMPEDYDRTDYYEKVSDYPYDTAWLPMIDSQ